MISKIGRRWPWIAAALFALAIAILFAMDRPPICTCGEVALWGPVGPKQSQMLADWYSASHIVHGFLFFAILWLAARRLPVGVRFLIAIIVEASWEIAENSSAVIDRYREATIALDYYGDSVVNSVSDILFKVLGFFLAARLPIWLTIAIAVGFELFTGWMIRDNLTLNVLMLIWPLDAVKAWQGGA